MSGNVPRPQRQSRQQAPVHITLPPATLFSPTGSASSNEFKHAFPATPGFCSVTPASERPNPFFVLNEESPPALVQRLRSAPAPPPVRRPALPPQVSLEHAFGLVRPTPTGRKDDHRYGMGDSACSPQQPSCSIPERSVFPSPSSPCSSRCEVRSQPDASEMKKKKRSRQRSSTIASAPAANPKVLLETPSFRSSAAGKPWVGASRNISLSEIPLFGPCEFNNPVDVFGLAAVQPSKLVPRRPLAVRRQTVQVLLGAEMGGAQVRRNERSSLGMGEVEVAAQIQVVST